MDYKKYGNYAVIAVVAVWIFCLSFAVSMKIARSNDAPTTLPPVIQTTAPQQTQQNQNTTLPTQSSGVTLNSGGNNIDVSPTAAAPTQSGVPAGNNNQQPQQTTNQAPANTLKVPGSKSEIKYLSYDEAYEQGFEDMRRRFPNTEKLNSLTGWKPQFRLDDIIRDVAEEIRSRQG